MTIIQLQYFNMVAQSGHVSNTALDMNISQSTISMSLMQLEERNIYTHNTGKQKHHHL